MPTYSNAIRGETGEYTGEHSITISFKNMNGEAQFSEEETAYCKNTGRDWHLVPASRPLVNPPEVKTKIIDNPGGDGIIDLSQAVTGFPVFGQRKGSWEFYVLNGWWNWYDIYSKIMNFLHGKDVQIRLDDDPEYYYNGRLTVNQWSSDKDHSKITIDYDLDPYKISFFQSTDSKWLWDEFNFNTGFISDGLFKGLKADPKGKKYTFKGTDVGRRPTTPILRIITPSSSVKLTKLTFINKELRINRSWSNYGTMNLHSLFIVFTGFDPENEISLVLTGDSRITVDVIFRPGEF